MTKNEEEETGAIRKTKLKANKLNGREKSAGIMRWKTVTGQDRSETKRRRYEEMIKAAVMQCRKSLDIYKCIMGDPDQVVQTFPYRNIAFVNSAIR